MERRPAQDAIGHPDILDAIMDICQAQQAYGTIALFALISKHHYSIVQPRLRRIRKRVVLNLEDYHWRDRENDNNIQVIECTRISPLPISLEHRGSETHLQNTIEALRTRLKPTTIIYRGQSHDCILKLWTYLFPSATLLVITEGAFQILEEAAAGLPQGTPSRWIAWERQFRNFVQTFFSEHAPGLMKPDNVLKLRYRQHFFHSTISTTLHVDHWYPRSYVFRGVAEDGKVVLEHDIVRVNSTFPESNIIPELISVMPNGRYDCMSLDCYVRLSDYSLNLFFHAANAAEDESPPGYQQLSERIEQFARSVLCNSRSRITFRLFILGPGDIGKDRADMVPIYNTTCGFNPAKKQATVVQRFIDEDYAKCRMNGGCKRCSDLGVE